MEYTSAQRAFLRSSAQRLSPVVMVGKEGVTAAVAKALCDAADCHELVKVRFQAHKDEVKELSFQLEKASGVDLIVTTAKALKAVGLKSFTVKINDRALLLSLLSALGVPAEMTDSVCITLDKLDKMGLDGVVGELTEKGVSEDCIRRLSDLFSEDVTLARVCGLAGNEEAAARLTYIMDTVRALVGDAFGLEYDVTLIRGQGYYTGTVFEVRSDEFRGSIAGGGRYDRLIGKFIGEDVPAVGFSIGFERIFSILRDAGVSVPDRRERIAFLYRHEEYLAAMKAAEDLRKEADVSMVEKTGKVGKLLARLEAYGFDGCAEFDEGGNLRRRAFGSK